MVQLAQCEPGIPIQPETFDADRMLLNVANGSIDLKTGRLHPHRREDLCSHLARVVFNENATCPRWMEFLAEVFEPHPDVPAFLRRAIGYSLTGDTREHQLFVLYGDGRNGKTTVTRTLMRLLGSYAGVAASSLLTASTHEDGPRPELTALRSVRLAVASETSDGARLNESLIKSITGGDRIRARSCHTNGFEFEPVFKLWLATNHRPAVMGTDTAIWSRLRLVPFDVCFLGREDRTLGDRLAAELPGILNWALQGCLEWQHDGLGTCASVATATVGYRTDSDAVIQFLCARVRVAPGVEIAGAALFSAFDAWANEQQRFHGHGVNAKSFGRRLGLLGVGTRRSKAGVVYLGLTLAEHAPDAEPWGSSETEAGDE
jgi:putative DNA primase/helicase